MTRAAPSRRAVAAFLLAAASVPAAPRPARAAESDRIVSLGGAVTEILDALGVRERIVAVDTTSVHPPDLLRTTPNVGYLRQLSAEGILSVRPTLVIAVDGAGPPDALRLVREAGVPVETVPDVPDEVGVLGKIATVARLVGREEAGTALARDVEARFAALSRVRDRLGRGPRALFVLSLQNGRVMAGGRATTADGMLRLAGAANAADAIEGYKPMTDEAIVAARPDVVVMMDNGPGGHATADALATPALAGTPAGQAGRLVTMNGLYLLGFGPRTPQAARDLMAALHPGQSLD